MSTIHWATGVSGTFTNGADWIGGVAPGSGDIAVIEAGGSSAYTVSATTPVAVAGLTLDDGKATMLVSKTSLTSPDIALQAGTLTLFKGTLAGTVAATGGVLFLEKDDATLKSVTWQGNLSPVFGPGLTTLVISKSLTLTGAGGTGAGSANFSGYVDLSGVSSLDNASISFAKEALVLDTSTLTLGAHLSLTGGLLGMTASQTLINDGTMTNGSVSAAGTITNNGTMAGNTYLTGQESLINNGLITAGAGQEIAIDHGAFGGTGEIDLASAALELGGTWTTAQLTAFYAAQHVHGSGSYGFGVSALDNAGSVLSVGGGTTLGAFEGGSVTGGTIANSGGSTLAIGNASLTDVTLTHAATVDADYLSLSGGTLSGVGTIAADFLDLDGARITGAGASPAVTLTIDGKPYGKSAATLMLEAGQSVKNDQIDMAAGANLVIASGAQLTDASVDFLAATKGQSLHIMSAGKGVTLGAAFVATIKARASVGVYTTGSFTLLNHGVFNVAGTMEIEALLGSTGFDNTGQLRVSAGGTLQSDANTLLTNTGTISATDGKLALSAIANNGLISASGTASSTTVSGSVSGTGTIAIAATGAGTLTFVSSVAAGQTIHFISGADALILGDAAAQSGFAATLAGFAVNDSIQFTGENLASATFSGDTILAKLSNGSTIALATSTALAGSLSVENSGGNGTLTYSSATPTLNDWSVPASARAEHSPAVTAASARNIHLPDSAPWFTLHHSL